MKGYLKYIIILLASLSGFQGMTQISPGKLSKVHTHLEGIANCTKCHVIGEKETTSKCLECHVEIQNLQNQNKGYHASEEVKAKKCAACHSDHHGLEFEIVRFDQKEFDHSLAGYELIGKHSKLECNACHKESLIKNKISQKKESSFLGLGTDCLSCHEDVHQKTLSTNCVSCHNQEVFKPAVNFDHSKTKYPLEGKHQHLDCAKCHKTILQNGKNFQQYAGVDYKNCTNCHEDVHENRFGNDCKKCHDLQSFKQVKVTNNLNHNQTKYPLQGAHQKVDCKKCHLKSYTTPIKFANCVDCHKDYHEGQFKKNNTIQDCADCHTNLSFSPTTYTLGRHQKSAFSLEGAHVAVPCFECHKRNEKWDFRNPGKLCIDCHENIHEDYLDKKYMPNNDCSSCHSVNIWREINFDHNKTAFNLEGKHLDSDCRDCHFKEVNSQRVQQFKWDSESCTNCHLDKHFKQFDIDGITSCVKCHTSFNWEPTLFNHDQSRFKLDGQHRDLRCDQCHLMNEQTQDKYRIYKLKDISCASCHS